jgi:hypothetical protein
MVRRACIEGLTKDEGGNNIKIFFFFATGMKNDKDFLCTFVLKFFLKRKYINFSYQFSCFFLNYMLT